MFGWAGPGEKVTVSLAGRSAGATADKDGAWTAMLGPLKAGGPFVLTAKSGASTARARGVLVGEVWVCSGQSNMEWTFKKGVTGGEKAVAAANLPRVRLFWGSGRIVRKPIRGLGGQWKVCTPKSVRDFSAVGYYFARHVHERLKVPVGMICISYGWTPAEAWMSREALSADPEIKRDVLDRWDRWVAEYPPRAMAYAEKLAAWKKAKQAAAAEGKPLPAEPPAPPNPEFIHQAAALFNGVVAPVIPYGIRGVLWYQGETNDNRAYQYRKLFPMLIRDWRRAWGQGDFPFLFVQLSTVGPPAKAPGESNWAELREAQAMALSEPNTAMAVTIDIGDGDVHPRNKADVGARLALAARATVYGEKRLPYRGPTYQSMTVQGGKIRVTFRHAEGLVAKGGRCVGFALAGKDRKFVWANARIDGESVLVSAPGVPKPVAVRYAWAHNPPNNLYNKAGLPACPFRTDAWPGVTADDTKMTFEVFLEAWRKKLREP
ncbi:MAG TPA: sialate O-acetylesterase [Phycisphaerae bacterium]|nr:sialate O-acetylesterase [Phycisphaerae bacterium]